MPINITFHGARVPTADRPLLGLTVLLVEDSRFACEAMRLLCLRSGARIRCADSLHNARRHLRGYRPDAVIVELGQPNDSGIELILELRRPPPGSTCCCPSPATRLEKRRRWRRDGFLAKPICRLDEFQQALLAHVPPDRRPGGLRCLPAGEEVRPDPVAFRDDQALAAQLRRGGRWDERDMAYLAQFLAGVAKAAGDAKLSRRPRRCRRRGRWARRVRPSTGWRRWSMIGPRRRRRFEPCRGSGEQSGIGAKLEARKH